MIFENNRYVQSPEIMERFKRGEDLSRIGVRVVDVGGVKRPVREFYVEESYVIKWMYPHLEPHGLIMKINPQPIELSDEMVKKDQDFWGWYSQHLLNDKAFKRDVVARKSFSKLRSAIAGLYVYRKRYQDAINAFRQSISLYPLSPEANYRLADTFMRIEDWESAVKTMEDFIANDPGNDRARKFLESIEQRRRLAGIRNSLEGRIRSGIKLGVNETLQLANIYAATEDNEKFERLARSIINDQSLPPQACQEVARLASKSGKIELVEAALLKYIQREPGDYSAWINLAALELYKRNLTEMFSDLKRAIDIGGDRAREAIRRDKRFQPISKSKPYQRLMQSSRSSGSGRSRPLPRNLQQLIK